jgi:hypothetical protein
VTRPKSVPLKKLATSGRLSHLPGLTATSET